MRLPLRNRRLLAVFALAAACAGLLAAWATASTRAHRVSATAVFRNDFVTFRHPAAWSAKVWKEQTLHFDPMVYLSTAWSGHDPCRTSTSETATTTACGWPIGRLAPNGVLVTWENRGFPGAAGRFSGTITRVGGRLAHLSVERPGACRGIGADETISIAIARPLADNWTQVDACLRGPRLAPLERQVRALLGSTRFLAP